MGRQTFRDESNRKHEPHAKHYVDDKFEKGTDTRNAKKNLKENESDENNVEIPGDKPVIPSSRRK